MKEWQPTYGSSMNLDGHFVLEVIGQVLKQRLMLGLYDCERILFGVILKSLLDLFGKWQRDL